MSCRSPCRGTSACRLRCRSRTAVSTATPSDWTTHIDRAPCRSCCCCTTGAHSCLVAPAVAAMPVSACSPHPPEPSHLRACRCACSSRAASNLAGAAVGCAVPRLHAQPLAVHPSRPQTPSPPSPLLHHLAEMGSRGYHAAAISHVHTVVIFIMPPSHRVSLCINLMPRLGLAL